MSWSHNYLEMIIHDLIKTLLYLAVKMGAWYITAVLNLFAGVRRSSLTDPILESGVLAVHPAHRFRRASTKVTG